MRLYSPAVMLIWITVVFGCSGTGTNPTLPDDHPLTVGATESPIGQEYIWGYYSLSFDLENGKVEVVPCRSAEFTLNVVKFLNNDPQGLQVSFNGTTPGTGYVDVDLDVTIKHPLSDHAYDGYDVRGIFMGNGAQPLICNSDLKYPVSGTDQILLNADGYTRWFNPTEFTVPKIFGYVPGKLASKGYTGTATLNPYKYFGEALGAGDDLWDYFLTKSLNVGYFLAGTSNTRNYIIRFPVPLPGVKYGYAVTANWSGTEPADHPSHAPEAVGLSVIDNSDVWFVDSSHKGGNLRLDLSVFDWDAQLTGGVMQDYQIKLETNVLSALHTLTESEMTPTASGTHWFTYHVEIPADNILSSGPNEMWVVVDDSTVDYTNPLGVPNSADGDHIAACFSLSVTVSNIEPVWVQVSTPNGGETWKVYDSEDITWTASTGITNVKIELSLDSAASYPQVISASTPNDGTYTWDPIPPEAQGTACRVMVSDLDNPGTYDESDADFGIAMPGIEVTQPNGGENWKVGDSQDITWTASAGITNMKIEQSLDSGVSYPQVIQASTTNDGTFSWDPIPPEAASNQCRIRISDVDNPLVNDESDADYVVYEPWIHLSSPNGGENWEVGSSHEITWECSETGGTVSIAYSKDNFYTDVNIINPDAPNDGSYMWDSIPADPSYYATVRVYLNDFNPFLMDFSDSYFSIAYPPSIMVLTPNGGEELKVGHSFEITWTSVTVPDPVHISYSKDGFQSDTHWIDVYTYNDGSYLWDPIPFDVSDTVRIKIESSADSDIYDISDADFEIAIGGWARTWGGSDNDQGFDVAVDGSGNSYVTGTFSGTVDFDPAAAGVDEHISNGGDDIFLSKFDPLGNFLWAKTWGGSGDEYSGGVTVDGSSNVYVTGSFAGTVDFDPGSGVDSHASNGQADIFLSKFYSTGDFSWACTWGGLYTDGSSGVAARGTGNVYVTGFFSTTVDFDPGAGVDEHASNGDHDIFLNKFDSYGTWQWADTWGGTGNDLCMKVASDAYNCAYVTGAFLDTVDFDPGIEVDNRTSNGDFDIYLSKIDSTGSYTTAVTWGGMDYDLGRGVAVDAWGKVYVAGFYENTVDFYPGGGGDIHTSNGQSDAFLSKFDSNLLYMWSRTWGGSSFDECKGVAVDTLGNVYLSGDFMDTADFDPGGGIDSHTSNGDADVFLSQFDTDGYFSWARTWGSYNMDEGSNVAADGSGNAFVTGYFSEIVDFDPGSDIDNHASNGLRDAFLSKFLPDGNW